jgi:hypothetical protein
MEGTVGGSQTKDKNICMLYIYTYIYMYIDLFMNVWIYIIIYIYMGFSKEWVEGIRS